MVSAMRSTERGFPRRTSGWVGAKEVARDRRSIDLFLCFVGGLGSVLQAWCCVGNRAVARID